jgi:hypothetical protein
MTPSGGYYPYAGDDPAGVESAMTELRCVGDTLDMLAGEVERDTRSIREFWPQGRTGELAAGDAARMGGALEEGHQAFESGFDSLADIDRAHAQVLRQVAEETTICDDLLNRLAGESSGLPGHASTSLP